MQPCSNLQVLSNLLQKDNASPLCCITGSSTITNALCCEIFFQPGVEDFHWLFFLLWVFESYTEGWQETAQWFVLITIRYQKMADCHKFLKYSKENNNLYNEIHWMHEWVVYPMGILQEFCLNEEGKIALTSGI